MSTPPRQTYRDEIDAVAKIRTMRRQLASGAGATIVRQKGIDDEQLMEMVGDTNPGEGAGTSAMGGPTFAPTVRKGAYGSTAIGLSVQSNYPAMLALFSESGGAPPVATTEQISIPFELFEAVQVRSAKLREMLEKAQADAVSKTEDLSKTRSTLRAVREENTALQATLEARTSEIDKLHATVQKLSEELAAAERKAVVAIDQKHDALRALKAKSTEAEEARFKASDLLVSVTQRESVIVALKREKAELQQRLQALEEADDDVSDEDLDGLEDGGEGLSADKLLSLHRSVKSSGTKKHGSPKASRLRAMLKGLVESNRQGPTRARIQELEAERAELQGDIAELYEVHDDMRRRMQSMARAYESHCLFLEDRLASGSFVSMFPKLEKGAPSSTNVNVPEVATAATALTNLAAASIARAGCDKEALFTPAAGGDDGTALLGVATPSVIEGSTRRAQELFLQDAAIPANSALFEPLSNVQTGASQLLQAVHELSTIVINNKRKSVAASSASGANLPESSDLNSDRDSAAENRAYNRVLGLLDGGLSNIKSSIVTIAASSSATSGSKGGPVFINATPSDSSLRAGGDAASPAPAVPEVVMQAWTKRVVDGSLFSSNGRAAAAFIMDPTKLGGEGMIAASFGIKRTTLTPSMRRGASGKNGGGSTWDSATLSSKSSRRETPNRSPGLGAVSSSSASPSRGQRSEDDSTDVTLSVPADCAVSRHLEGAADVSSAAPSPRIGDGAIRYAAGHSSTSLSVSPVDNLMSALHVYRTIIMKLLGYGANLSTALEEAIKLRLKGAQLNRIQSNATDLLNAVPVVSPAQTPDSRGQRTRSQDATTTSDLSENGSPPLGIGLTASALTAEAVADRNPFGNSFSSADGIAAASLSGSLRGGGANSTSNADLLSMWRRSVPRAQLHPLLKEALDLHDPRESARVGPLLQSYFDGVMLLKFGVGVAMGGPPARASSIGGSASLTSLPSSVRRQQRGNVTAEKNPPASTAAAATSTGEQYEIEVAQYLGATEGMASVAATSDTLFRFAGGEDATSSRHSSSTRRPSHTAPPSRQGSTVTGRRKPNVKSFRNDEQQRPLPLTVDGSPRAGVLHKKTLSMQHLKSDGGRLNEDLSDGRSRIPRVDSFTSARTNSRQHTAEVIAPRPSQRAALTQAAANSAARGKLRGRDTTLVSGPRGTPVLSQDLTQGLVGSSLGGRVQRNAQMWSEKLITTTSHSEDESSVVGLARVPRQSEDRGSAYRSASQHSSARSSTPESRVLGNSFNNNPLERGGSDADLSSIDHGDNTEDNPTATKSPTTKGDDPHDASRHFYKRNTIEKRASTTSRASIEMRTVVSSGGMIISSFPNLGASPHKAPRPLASPRRLFGQKTYPAPSRSSPNRIGREPDRPWRRQVTTTSPFTLDQGRSSPASVRGSSLPRAEKPNVSSKKSSIRIARRAHRAKSPTAARLSIEGHVSPPSQAMIGPSHAKSATPTSPVHSSTSGRSSTAHATLGASHHLGESDLPLHGSAGSETTAPPSSSAVSAPPSRESRQLIKTSPEFDILGPRKSDDELSLGSGRKGFGPHRGEEGAEIEGLLPFNADNDAEGAVGPPRQNPPVMATSIEGEPPHATDENNHVKSILTLKPNQQQQEGGPLCCDGTDLLPLRQGDFDGSASLLANTNTTAVPLSDKSASFVLSTTAGDGGVLAEGITAPHHDRGDVGTASTTISASELCEPTSPSLLVKENTATANNRRDGGLVQSGTAPLTTDDTSQTPQQQCGDVTYNFVQKVLGSATSLQNHLLAKHELLPHGSDIGAMATVARDDIRAAPPPSVHARDGPLGSETSPASTPRSLPTSFEDDFAAPPLAGSRSSLPMSIQLTPAEQADELIPHNSGGYLPPQPEYQQANLSDTPPLSHSQRPMSMTSMTTELTLPAIHTRGGLSPSGSFFIEGGTTHPTPHSNSSHRSEGSSTMALPALSDFHRRSNANNAGGNPFGGSGGGSSPSSPNRSTNTSRGAGSGRRRTTLGTHAAQQSGDGSTFGSPFLGGSLSLEGSSIHGSSRNASRRQSAVLTGSTINVPPTGTSSGGLMDASQPDGAQWRRRASTKLDNSNPSLDTSEGRASPLGLGSNAGDGVGGGRASTSGSRSGSRLDPNRRQSVVTLIVTPTPNTAGGAPLETSPQPTATALPTPVPPSSGARKDRPSKLSGVSVKTTVAPSGSQPPSTKQGSPSSAVGGKRVVDAAESPAESHNRAPPPATIKPGKKTPASPPGASSKPTGKKEALVSELGLPDSATVSALPSSPSGATTTPSKQPKKPATPNAKKARPNNAPPTALASSHQVKSILASPRGKQHHPHHNETGPAAISRVKFAEHDEVVWIPPREPKVLPAGGGRDGGTSDDDSSPATPIGTSGNATVEWQSSAPHSNVAAALHSFDTTGAIPGESGGRIVQIDIKRALAMVLPFDDEDELEELPLPIVTANNLPEDATTTALVTNSSTDPPASSEHENETQLGGSTEHSNLDPTVAPHPTTLSTSSTEAGKSHQQQFSSITNKPLPPHIQRILEKQQEKARQQSSQNRVQHQYTTMGALVAGGGEITGLTPSTATMASTVTSPPTSGGGSNSQLSSTPHITPRAAGSLTSSPFTAPGTAPSSLLSPPTAMTSSGGSGNSPAARSGQVSRGNSNTNSLAPPSAGYLSHHRRSR